MLLVLFWMGRAFTSGVDPLFGLLVPLVLLLLSLGFGVPLAGLTFLIASWVAMRTFRCPRCGSRFVDPLDGSASCRRCGLKPVDES